MKQKISYGSWNKSVDIITTIIWIIFIAVFVLFLVFWDKSYDRVWFWLSFGFLIFGWCWSFFCIPVSISADDDYVSVNRPFRSHKFRRDEIQSVERYNREKRNPFRYGYYGAPKNPVLITLKNGKQYVVGTSDPDEFISYINERNERNERTKAK